MKYLITTYKDHDIFYIEEDESFESAAIKKYSLTDMKLALDFKVLGKKYKYLRVYGNQVLHYYPCNMLETVNGRYVQLPDKERFIKLEGKNQFDYLIANTKENVIVVKELQKKLKAAEQAVKKAFNSQAKVVDTVQRSISNVAKQRA